LWEWFCKSEKNHDENKQVKHSNENDFLSHVRLYTTTYAKCKVTQLVWILFTPKQLDLGLKVKNK